MITQLEDGLWWGNFSVEEKRVLFWQVGPLRLWVRRTPFSWQVAYDYSSDYLETTLAHSTLLPNDPSVPDLEKWLRFGFAQTDGQLSLSPLLADRAVVTRPESTFIIPGGEKATLYVSTPIWVRLRVGEAEKLLLEVPTWRPSDTWFGSPTYGELCYASRTSARLEIEQLPERPHRAITPLVVENLETEPLPLQYLAMPIPYLSLYADPRHRLWTNRLTLTREADQTQVRAQAEREAPPTLHDARQIAEARIPSNERFVIRAFSSLFK